MADRKPLVYVASPITRDPWRCVRRATDAAEFLATFDVHAYLPQLSVLHEIVAPQPYEHWIEHGLAMLERCDGFLRLTGESPGADVEATRAIELDIPRLATAVVGETRSGTFMEWLDEVRARTAQR